MTQTAMQQGARASARTKGGVLSPAQLVVFAALFLCGAAPSQAGDLFGFFRSPSSLHEVERSIARRYSDISHMPPANLAATLARHDKVLLIDVRESSEFAVSRLPGAIRVQPGISLAALYKILQDQIQDRAIVFYCSVGERSSRLARRAKQHLLAEKAASVHNLKGGVFAWHNQRRPLVDNLGSTPFVHPFNDRWGKLLQRRTLARMTPGSLL